MAVGVNDVVSQMRALLSLSDPDLDTTVGTVTRKILDVVGEVVAESYLDRYLLDYQYDIDTKIGADLDAFVSLFGFTRLTARRAVGTITFERTGSTTAVTIPVGSQLGTNTVTVQTVVPAMMLVGDTSITVPAQAMLGGASGNIPANSLRLRQTPLDGVASFSNLTAFTGGTDPESDEQLRLRFKRTIFRNLAGTEQMFTAVALEDRDVTQVNVLGASRRRREQIQVTGGTATSTLPATSIRYVYANSSIFGANIDGGSILTPNVHYTFNPTSPPSITGISGAVPDGIYDFEFEYIPAASRNDPTNGVTNRVDIYVNGTRATEATETALWRTTRTFNATVGDPLNRTNFLRSDSTTPTVGNYFVALAFAPAIDASVNNQITIGAVTYTEGVDYWVVNDITAQGGTSRSLSGLEFLSAANGQTKAIPADGATFGADYIFNAIPRDIEQAIATWRLITTDVRVHQAKVVLLNVSMAVMLTPGLSLSAVQPAISSAISQYIATVGFGGVVQISDLLEVAHQVNGVDAVRLLTSSDNATVYGVQRVSSTGAVLTTYSSGGRAADVIINDDEVPALNAVTVVQRAQNSMGVV